MEEQPKKLFYTMGEVACLFNVNTSLIRFWEKEFEVIRPQRNKKGNRLFSQRDLDYFHQIYHLVKEEGYTLQGAKEQLKANPMPLQEARLAVAENLRRIRSMLLELKELC